jgi:hypothetical protein
MQMKPPTNPSPMFEKRKKLFEHYFAVLGRVIDANPQSFNEKFRNQNNGRVGDREDVMQYSQDPENVKGAGKFLVMVAAGGLLALNGISDVMNKRFSFVTMVLLGSVIMLVGKKPKYAFMEGNGFNEMTRKHFDEEGTRRVMGLTGGQSNLLKSKFLELKGAVITQAHIDDLTDRKKYKGRAIPKDVAQRFLGVNSSLARNFVMNMQGIKTDRDRRLVVEYARANHGEGQMQKDVKAARGSAATTVAVTDAASGKTSEEELDS